MGLGGPRRHGLRGGPEGGRDALDAFVVGAQADGEVANRVTADLAEAPRGARPAGACAAPGPQGRALTGWLVPGPRRCARPAPARAAALVQAAVVDRHRAGRPRDAWMGGGGRQGHHVALAPGPGAGLDARACRGVAPRGPVAPVLFLATACAGGGCASALGCGEGGSRRRGLAGGVGRLGPPAWQGCDWGLALLELARARHQLARELREVLRLALAGVWNGWGCELPREVATGKRPQEGGGMRVRGRRRSQPGACRCGVGAVRLSGSNVPKL
jgi:hypothetical protein